MKQIDITEAEGKTIKSVVIGYDNQIAITFDDGEFSYIEIESFGECSEINRIASFAPLAFGERAPMTGIVSQAEYDAQVSKRRQETIDLERHQYERLKKIFEPK